MRKVVLGAFVIFGVTERVVADDLSDGFRNDFDGTLAPAFRIPSVVSPNLDVPAPAGPVPVLGPKLDRVTIVRLTPRHLRLARPRPGQQLVTSRPTTIWLSAVKAIAPMLSS
jgi:hypothetical protein